jgi:ribosomal protein S18 acetylase RimI-like enzyme
MSENLKLPAGVVIRPAGLADLDYLVATDLLGEGYTDSVDAVPPHGASLPEHRAKIAAFVAGAEDMAWICEHETGDPVGMIMARYRDLFHEANTEANRFLYRFLDKAIFPVDGRFCEVFNLWVHPAWRRQGLATALKLTIENEARRRGMSMVYTHTETTNAHVIELNRKLGYQIVRVGPIWDEIERTSLVKWL